MTDEPQPRPRSGVFGRAWADLPLRAKGLVVVAIPLLALLLATVLFGVALAEDRRAQGAVLHTVEVERQIAQVRILVQAGVTGYVLTGERRYLTSYQQARQELPRSIASLGALVSDNPGQAGRVATVGASPTGGPGSCGPWSPTSGPTGRRAPGSACWTATRRPPTPWSPSWRPWPTPSSACSPAARPRPAGPGPWPWARSA
jgi:hypothetical protein